MVSNHKHGITVKTVFLVIKVYTTANKILDTDKQVAIVLQTDRQHCLKLVISHPTIPIEMYVFV